MKTIRISAFLISVLTICLSDNISAQGTWTPLTQTSPDVNAGVMLLLTDGSVIVKATDNSFGYGNNWNKLTPDSTGSYVNGTWSIISPMLDTRYYFSSQVLQNGKVYVAGGEYGTGSAGAELYDPIADTWTSIPGIPAGDSLADANSKILPDGRVLQSVVYSGVSGVGNQTLIYDPVTNVIGPGPTCVGSADESAWLKLPDNSILFVDFHSRGTDRYQPASNLWHRDAPTSTLLYDNYVYETGPGTLLPDGTALFLGSNGQSAIYYPSGDTTPGGWITGLVIPDGNGTPDAPSAMMADGHVLFAASPVPNASNMDSFFHTPTYFYEYNYANDSFISVPAPNGQRYLDSVAAYSTTMLNLPDGNILFATQYYDRYYVYTPGNPPLALGKPTINTVSKSGCDFMITGHTFNGISEGSAYGDDWQMATNYPIVRLSTGGRVYYARTYNWNSTAVQSTLPDTAYFSIPANVPNGNYSLSLSANGISSDPFSFSYISCHTGIDGINEEIMSLQASPNPAHEQAILSFNSAGSGDYTVMLSDVCGRIVLTDHGNATEGRNSHTLQLADLAKGVYTIRLEKGEQSYVTKMVVE